MNRVSQKEFRKPVATGFGILALLLGLAGGVTRAHADEAPYPAMAPADQYLIPDQAAEIAQARAAAPPSIGNAASVMVLTLKGYETVATGTNGFVCMVQRAWFSGLDDSEFWNPKTRAPICFNPQAVRSILPAFLERTQWALSGASRAEITERTKAEIAANTFPVPEIGTLTYMMAKDAYHSDRVHGPWHPHLMFFLPRIRDADWGANLPGSPVMGGSDDIEPYTIFFVPLATWSDGSPDTHPMHM